MSSSGTDMSVYMLDGSDKSHHGPFAKRVAAEESGAIVPTSFGSTSLS